MKKILFLCFSVLFTNFIYSQVTVNAPSSVEVGVNNNFGFTFLPKSSEYPSGSTSYKLTSWFINDGSSNMNNSGFGSYSNNSQSLNTYSIGQSLSLNFPIKWEDNSNSLTSTISIITNVNYYGVVNGTNQLLGSRIHSKTHTVNINRIFTPTISSPTILSCCNNPVTFSASNFGTANVFNWSISGGSFTGSGSSITVTPSAGNGSVFASCTVSRSSGLSTYTRSGSSTVSRTARTANYTVSSPPVYTYTGSDYLCKGSGRVFSIAPQCGLQSVTWSAPNCTIAGQGTTNATITPNSIVPNGSIINISATVSYVGGCSVSTQVTPFIVFGEGNTTPPLGTVSISANPPNVSLQNTSEWITSFKMQKGTASNYGNGIFVLNPSVLQVEQYGRTATVQVCYLNVCNGNQSCTDLQVWVPGIAPWNPYKMANTKDKNKIEPQELNTVFPNPTNGVITIAFEKNVSGTYQIVDMTGRLIVQEGKINNQTELQIELSQKLKSGIYILKVNTENNSFTEKIILNR
jgi:hypothetical protein